jgi:hypothetical protein
MSADDPKDLEAEKPLIDDVSADVAGVVGEFLTETSQANLEAEEARVSINPLVTSLYSAMSVSSSTPVRHSASLAEAALASPFRYRY